MLQQQAASHPDPGAFTIDRRRRSSGMRLLRDLAIQAEPPAEAGLLRNIRMWHFSDLTRCPPCVRSTHQSGSLPTPADLRVDAVADTVEHATVRGRATPAKSTRAIAANAAARMGRSRAGRQLGGLKRGRPAYSTPTCAIFCYVQSTSSAASAPMVHLT